MARAFLILFLLLAGSDLFAAEPQYTRTRDLPALKMSFTDVQFVLDKAAHLLADANREAKEAKKNKRPEELLFFQPSPGETLTLGTGPDEIKIEGHNFPATARLPKAAYALSYLYLWTDAPVSRLQLDLGDYTRRLGVSGTAVDQVEAISAALERELSQHSAIGGAIVRDSTRYTMILILALSLLYGGAYCIAERRWRYLGIPIFALVGLVLLLTLPVKDLFAGFAVYQGEPSWIVRSEPQIAFVSLIIAIAAIPLSFFIPIWLDAGRKNRA